MSRVCQVTGARPQAGRSYAIRGIAKKKKGIGLKTTGITKRRFLPNLKKKRIFNPATKTFITLKVSAGAMRTIDKNGIVKVLSQLN